MLTKTAIRNPAFLAKVDRAMRQAVARPGSPSLATVKNGKGEETLLVVYHRGADRGPGRAFEFVDRAERDVTADMLAALRASVATQPDRSA